MPAMHALVAGGADIIELGVPFSDPEADGPAVQAGSERALANGTTLSDVLGMVAAFRATDADTPVVLMGYLNVFLKMGYEPFCRAAGEAGVDGVIVVNLPPEEAGDFRAALRGTRARPGPAGRTDNDGRACSLHRKRGLGLPLLRQLQGHHRRRTSRCASRW